MKIRDEATWAAVRRAWEDGETGASLARRFDVGLANLWRRRAAEGWERGREADPTPEPAEGWEGWAHDRYWEFMQELETQREIALALLAGLRSEPEREMPLWHIGFYYAWRARHLGAGTAAADRERAGDAPWAEAVWRADGTVRPPAESDALMLRLNRDAWRALVGLPDGKAEDWP